MQAFITWNVSLTWICIPYKESKYYKEFVKEFPQFGDNIPGKVKIPVQ